MSKYHVTYEITPHPEGLEKADILGKRDANPNTGASDAVILISVLHQEDGSTSTAVISIDGRTGDELSSLEIWKAWAFLAYGLSRSATLSKQKRELCASVHEMIRKAVFKARNRLS